MDSNRLQPPRAMDVEHPGAVILIFIKTSITVMAALTLEEE